MTSLARSLWEAVEPFHAATYFAPEPADAAKGAGLRGWWMGYFAARFAPLGPIGSEPVAAMAFGFAPAMVRRALPDAWSYASPADVLAGRLASTGAALRRIGGDVDVDVARLTHLLEVAGRGARFDGRPLGAAWSSVAPPDEPMARLWLASAVLREHRGDGHVLAAVERGLSGLEAGITNVGAGTMPRSIIQTNRGWTDDEWDAAVTSLADRGLLDAEGRLTPAGRDLRADLEAATDRLATSPVDAIGDDAAEEAIALAVPLSRAVFGSGTLPLPNPVGVPRP